MWHPFSRDEILAHFDRETSVSKHLLILYSMVIGLNAKVIVEFGLGQTTRTLRAAALVSGGILHTCDFDRRRFSGALAEQDEHWRLYLEPSKSFIPKIQPPIDFALHDGAHDYWGVRSDLEALIPRMRKFGIICVHDTQQTDLHRHVLPALRDATRNASVSLTNLPFCAGLAIIRIEASEHPAISPSISLLSDGRPETCLVEFPTVSASDGTQISAAQARAVNLKVTIGHVLRQMGLKS
jgi:hypothetical protein